MMFDDLPAPKAKQQPEAAEQQHVDDHRPEKRARTGDAPAGNAGGGSGAAAERRSPPPLPGDAAAPAEAADAEEHQHEQQQQQQQPAAVAADQVGPALLRIAGHISNPAKFAKAAGLLRQLVASGALARLHRAPFFAALSAAYADPAHADEPQLRREYRRLLNAVTNGVPPGVLSEAQAGHLEVYAIWTHQRGELATDDSFVFNKAISRLKEDIAAMGPVSAAEEAAARGLQLPGGARRPRGEEDAAAAGPAAGAAAARQEEARREEVEEGEAEEADPFGLDDFMKRNEEREEAERRRAAAAAGPAAQRQEGEGEDDGAWSAAELSVMRRQALLDCITAAKAMHKLAWARTSVEMLIEDAHGHIENFAAPQREVLADYMRWVKAERAARRSGAARPGGGTGGGKEMTSFEKARAEWGKAAVSRYGKVGGAGDAKSTHWLG